VDQFGKRNNTSLMIVMIGEEARNFICKVLVQKRIEATWPEVIARSKALCQRAISLTN